MTQTGFSAAALAFHEKRGALDEYLGKTISPLLRESNRLRAILRKHVLKTGDAELDRWLHHEERDQKLRQTILSDKLREVESTEMNFKPLESSDEEMDKNLEHAERLAELNLKELELHAEFIRDQNKRLKEKIESLGLKS